MKLISNLKNKYQSVVHCVENDRKKPQVAICTYKDRDGSIKDATLSVDLVNKIPKITRNTLIAYATLMPMGLLYRTNADAARMDKAAKEVVLNIEQAKKMSESEDEIVWDEKLPLPSKLAKSVQAEGSSAAKFYNALKENKENLMEDLNLTEEEYNNCAVIALKIAKEESALGSGNKYKMYEAIEQYDVGMDAISNIRKLTKGDGALSLGLTRLKIDGLSEKEKQLLDEYDIKYGDNNNDILNPEKSAVATMIHLATLGKDYKKYLENCKENKPDINTTAAKKSIANAQKIIFNNELRKAAIDALLAPNDTEYETMMLEACNLNQKDLDDLRFYASIIELSPQAYLAARWNGKKVLPIGERKDIACANLLYIAAQKGYIANIDKTSKVLY